MKIIKENVSISDWDFSVWAGAKDTLKSILISRAADAKLSSNTNIGQEE